MAVHHPPTQDHSRAAGMPHRLPHGWHTHVAHTWVAHTRVQHTWVPHTWVPCHSPGWLTHGCHTPGCHTPGCHTHGWHTQEAHTHALQLAPAPPFMPPCSLVCPSHPLHTSLLTSVPQPTPSGLLAHCGSGGLCVQSCRPPTCSDALLIVLLVVCGPPCVRCLLDAPVTVVSLTSGLL